MYLKFLAPGYAFASFNFPGRLSKTATSKQYFEKTRIDLPKAVERLLYLQGCSKLVEDTIQKTKDCITGNKKDGLFVKIKKYKHSIFHY